MITCQSTEAKALLILPVPHLHLPPRTLNNPAYWASRYFICDSHIIYCNIHIAFIFFDEWELDVVRFSFQRQSNKSIFVDSWLTHYRAFLADAHEGLILPLHFAWIPKYKILRLLRLKEACVYNIWYIFIENTGWHFPDLFPIVKAKVVPYKLPY